MLLRKLALAHRSALCFGFFFMTITALGLLSLRQAAALHEAEKFVEDNVVTSVKLIGKIVEQFQVVQLGSIRARDLFESEKHKASLDGDIKNAWNLIDEYAGALSELIVLPEGRQAISDLIQVGEKYKNIQADYLVKVKAGQLDSAMEVYGLRMEDSAKSFGVILGELIRQNEWKADNAGERATQVYSDTVIAIILFLVVGGVSSMGFAFLYTRSLTSPLSESLRIAESIAQNDLSKEIVLSGSDEAARMIRSLSIMQEKLRSALSLIGDSSTQLAATSEEMHAVTESAARTIQRQSDELEMAATAVTEMSTAVEDIAGNAASTSQLTSESSAVAIAGRKQVEETVGAINIMVSNVEETSSEIKALATMTTDISKVLDVIGAIAEQTNLLALNAAIEAARAGEAGRGFAVVADEVRALAHRTQQSTHEIEKMVGSIQSGTTNAVASMRQTSEQAQRTLQMAYGAGEVLNEITSSLGQINERNLMIAAAAEEQAQVSREVDRNLVSIHDLSSETAEGSSQTTLAAAEIAALAVDLSHLTKQFRL